MKAQPQRSVLLPQLINQALALHQRGRLAEAERFYLLALKAKPDYFDAGHLLGVLRCQQGRHREALPLIEQALKTKPNNATALSNHGHVLEALRRFEDALASYDKALAIKPNFAEALNGRGNALQVLTRFDDALADYDKALAIRSNFAEALNNRGNILQVFKRFDEALADYDKALAIEPDFVGALNNRGNVLQVLGRFADAVDCYDKALAIKPNFADALNNRGNALRELRRFEDALSSYEKALAIEPAHAYAFNGLAFSALEICDWTRTARLAAEMHIHVAERKSIVSPFNFLGYCDDAAIQRKCAGNFIQERMPTLPQPLWNGAIWRNDRIKIAYLSAEFRQAPGAQLAAELFERHDRSRFEVIGVSYGPDDQSKLRARVMKAFDQFHDVRSARDCDVAQLLRRTQTDIAVDLTGYTTYCRPEILAYRPAPIAVQYLGYPGTMSAPFIDYIIADKIVLPFDQQPYFAENIVHLPDSYQVNNSELDIAAEMPDREAAGLPEKGFIFCCFNNSFKVTRSVFDIWMRLLHRVEGSVLWLLSDSEPACSRLRSEAVQHGIDPARLVFAPRQPLAAHLARYRLADLFLDTLPYNAHTTASDALREGLPLLTCCGRSFAGRVATSLLNAIGLPELVTADLEAYEELALRLATDASLLSDVKRRLERNRLISPLFDTDRFRRHIEAAYTTMWELWQRGESPRKFSVEQLDAKIAPQGVIIAREFTH